MNDADADQLDLDRFCFRGLPCDVSVGTASDRYGGWLGQIYSEAPYQGRIQRRSRQIGGKALVSKILPVDSVREYFQHFSVLEIDFTFYSPLIDRSGKRTRTYRTLAEYAQYLRPDDRILIKTPQVVFARKLYRGGKYLENPDFLNADLFAAQFYAPAVELLGPSLRGFIFEQEYQKAAERPAALRVAEQLDEFFQRLPPDGRYHVELRTESFLAESVFQVLAERGVGLVLSHWTWLPPLAEQLRRTGGHFWNGADDLVVRLLTPPNVRYEDAFNLAHPFDQLREDMLAPKLIPDTVAVIEAAVAARKRANIIVNNRAAGNAPILAQRLAAAWLARRSAAGSVPHGR